MSSFLIEAEANRFGVINAFTNAAQKLGPLQRIEMERFAGTLLEAPYNSSSVTGQAKKAWPFIYAERVPI